MHEFNLIVVFWKMYPEAPGSTFNLTENPTVTAFLNNLQSS